MKIANNATALNFEVMFGKFKVTEIL